MKIEEIQINNIRCISQMTLKLDDYLLLVGANNSGKSTVIHALRLFYGDETWDAKRDRPLQKTSSKDKDSWVQLTFGLTVEEARLVPTSYLSHVPTKGEDFSLTANSSWKLMVRCYFVRVAEEGEQEINAEGRAVFARVDGINVPFSGTKRFGFKQLGKLIYIPALTKTEDQLKLSDKTAFSLLVKQLLSAKLESSRQFRVISQQFKELNTAGTQPGGIFHEFTDKLNGSLRGWNIVAGLNLAEPTPEDLLKLLLQPRFIDKTIDGSSSMELNCFGLGFQRTVINGLIRMLADEVESERVPAHVVLAYKHTTPFEKALKVVLYEEPEAFMHPSQQVALNRQLKQLAANPDFNVIVTSHSSTFASKTADSLGNMVRLQREKGEVQKYQPDVNQVLKQLDAHTKQIDQEGGSDLTQARDELFYQIWLEAERGGVFFADKVLMVEGATERVVFSYLLENDWSDLLPDLGNFQILEANGKFNFVRFGILLRSYGIHFGVIADDDGESKGTANPKQCRYNQEIRALSKSPQWKGFLLAKPVFLPDCLEDLLKDAKTQTLMAENDRRRDMKAVAALADLQAGRISRDRKLKLKQYFKQAVGLADVKAEDERKVWADLSTQMAIEAQKRYWS